MYLKMGLTTIPEFLEKRFDSATRTMDFFSNDFICRYFTSIVLYTGAINLESIFNISKVFGISKNEEFITVLGIGIVGSIYAIFGGLKAVAISDTINGLGLLIGGLAIPFIALVSIGEGNPITGLVKVFENSPEKFNVIGAKDSVMPFEVLFTGLIINQLYFEYESDNHTASVRCQT